MKCFDICMDLPDNAELVERRSTVGRHRSSWTVVALCAAALLVIGQLYSVLPLLVILSTRWGVSPSAAAWLATAFGFAYAAGMLISGPLSDRFGRRKLALVGVFTTAIITLSIAFSPNFPTALILRIVQGLAAACFAPAVLAYIPEQIPPPLRSFALSALIGSFLAAAIVAPIASQELASAWVWNGWFLVTAALLVLNGIVLAFTLKKYRSFDGAPPGIGAAVAKLPAMVKNPTLRWLYLATLTVMCGFVGVTTAMQLTGPAGLATDPNRLQLVRALTLPVCIAVPAASIALRSFSTRSRVFVAIAVGAVALAAMSLDFGVVWLCVCLALLTCSVAVAAPALIEAIGAAGAHARGAATALYGFAMFTGASIGPLIATHLAPLGFVTVTRTLALVMAVGTVCATRGLTSNADSK
mgnify:CR=1 FL=1